MDIFVTVRRATRPAVLWLALAQAGCEGGTESITTRTLVPTAPTAAAPPPAPTPRPRPLPPEVPGPWTGSYAAAFSAAPECTHLPDAARTRRYIAEVYHAANREIVVRLSGADFQAGYEAFWGVVDDNQHVRLAIGSKMAHDAWHEWEPIIERLSAAVMVTTLGNTVKAALMPFDGTALPFEGTVSYCDAMQPAADWWPATCAAPVACRSDRHTLALEPW